MQTTTLSLADSQNWRGAALIAASFVTHEGAAYWLEESGGQRQLAVLAPPDHAALADLAGQPGGERDGYHLTLAPADHATARWLRGALPWLTPRPIGQHTSAGFGDRLGLATPGHIRALREVLAATPGATIAPIFAQQSIREMARTHRTPAAVLNDATWGTFAAGWVAGVGADADHLKTPEDIDACAAEGYSLYTIDPGLHVDDAADGDDPATLHTKLGAVPWDRLETTAADFLRRYAGRTFALEARSLTLSEPEVIRAAVKYGAAIAYVARMYRHLITKGIPTELEVSVDETATPTTAAEHLIFASELRRLGVQWVSLAPRFVGAFEKGTDYIGDLDALRADLAVHAQIARVLGPYKLSLHSGSDKFSVYPLFVEATHGVGHLKTAGTSYVEALRVIAAADPALFREILRFDAGRYPTDRATYHVSAEVARLPDPAQVPVGELAALLNNHDVRQVVHVTYGSTLDQFHDAIFGVLRANQGGYDAVIARHFVRHLAPFAVVPAPAVK
ncbi:MAG: hypothetical protein H0X24_09055 [Ktedonobacterales bacterium]|nr:hypothetical protein [Ktedonobacterales bacterium]